MTQSSAIHRNIEWVLLGLIVLAAFAIRIYRLDSFPDTLMPDEADNTQSSIQILNGMPPNNGLFGIDWTQQPAFSVYKGAAFIAIFGLNMTAIRLPSVVFTTLAMIPFYLLLRRQLMVVPSLLATILLATSVWFLNFSRSGWNNPDICFYMLMAMLFLCYAIDATTKTSPPRKVRWLHFALAGFFCALGLYGYPGGRAIILGVAASFPIILLMQRKHWKNLLWGYIFLAGVTAVAFAPQAEYILRNWDIFNGRSGVVLIFNQPEYQEDPTGTLLRQLDKNIRAPWDGEVNNAPRYTPVGEPQLEQITGLLTLLGMVLSFALAHLRTRYETWLWWLMLLCGWALTQLLTSNTPDSARGVGYMPTFIYFAGVGLDAILRGISTLITKLSPNAVLAQRIAPAFFTLVVLFIAYNNVIRYVTWQSTPNTRLMRSPYVTVQEFPEWSATIVELAKNQRMMNVGEWREVHPLEDESDPYGTDSSNESS